MTTCPYTDRCKAYTLTLVHDIPALLALVRQRERCTCKVPELCPWKAAYDSEIECEKVGSA